MLTPRTTLARRVTAALDASPSRIPVLARRLRQRPHDAAAASCASASGAQAAQYIDVERTATTPERFLRAVTSVSPFPVADTSAAEPPARAARSTRRSRSSTRARTAAGEPATFLLDEFLELRTFESFPGLRRVLHDCVDGLAASGNRFVLTSRYVARALRLLRDRSARFEVIHMPALDRRGHARHPRPDRRRRRRRPRCGARRRLSRAHRARARRRPAGLRARARRRARADARARRPGQRRRDQRARRAARAPTAASPKQCGFCYELRLHRARGYGALKAILEILAEEEGLTLTEISQRLQRTPGLDEGLSVVARGRRPRHVAAEALQLHRSAAARLGAPALPPVGADRRRPRARSAALRAAAAAAAGPEPPPTPQPSPRSRWPAAAVRDHRNRLRARWQSFAASEVTCSNRGLNRRSGDQKVRRILFCKRRTP